MAKTISNSFTVNIVEDGESTPYYFQEWYAWSNDTSTANVNTPPTLPNGKDWVDFIQDSYATYLWRKSIRYTWNESTREYIVGNAQYFRMSGTNGTSIHTKGSVVDYVSSPPNFRNDANDGDKGICVGIGYLYIYSASQQTWNISQTPVVDGDAYTLQYEIHNKNGHLLQWSAEEGNWLDLGQFKGENGKTYYSHIVYATNVNYSGSTVTSIEGYTPTKSPNDTTHFWMGTYVDENSADPTSGSDPILLSYTWSYTKGNDGEDAYSVETNPTTLSIECDANGNVLSNDYVTVLPKMYKGSTLVSGTLSNINGNKLVAVAGTSSEGIRIYGRLRVWKASGGGEVYTINEYPNVQVGETAYRWKTGDILEPFGTVTSTGTVYIVVNGTQFNRVSAGTKIVNLATPTTLTFTITSGVVSRNVEMQVVGNKTGEQGKMSRNIYFAGLWSDLINNTFEATDHKAPYVRVRGTDENPICYSYIGANGTGIAYPTSQAAYQSSSDWEIMYGDFKYLITQAIFAAFAKLGSWIFNGDYMLSQTGVDGTQNYEDFEGEDGAWQPNLYMNAYAGRIVANDIVLRGVLNNMINTISNSTDLAKYGTYETSTKYYYLNPLKVGQYLSISSSVMTSGATLVLPVLHNNGGTSFISGGFTLQEMRQMVGKQIHILVPARALYILADSDNDAIRLLIERKTYYNNQQDLMNIGTSEAYIQFKYVPYYKKQVNPAVKYVYKLTCKAGYYNNYECIYWEIETLGNAW